MNDDDLSLLGRWCDGDRVAGDVLIRRYYDFAARLALRRLDGDEDGASEVVQRAFETLLHKREVIETSFKGYLRRVIMLTVLSFRRKRRVDATTSSLEAAGRGAESEIAQQEEIKLMVLALRKLSLEDQLLLAYAYGDEKTQREIAESLELGLAQCNSKLYRARQRLRARLEAIVMSSVRESTLGGFETWLASVHAHVR